ncbi:Eco57I restriction-modification methylase domain-containing protein [Natronomonas sp. LN261]|uniref:Eco57I restriction-modification methylase domain-containing protein n=1 Tax=Natronomonas sp. LN261 TaxID=2750669 RepID=UPI0015EECD21|nr:N-6 DNA methylase [Natronomonas sp. LN261]
MNDPPTTPAAGKDEFVEDVIIEYLDLYTEIQEGERAEHDLMPRLVDHLFINALGWEKSDYTQEDDWNDVRFYDDDRNPAIIVEGKRRDVDVEEGIQQVFRYASETPYARYLISTNVDKFIVYKRCDDTYENAVTHHGVSARKVADVPFQGICNRASGNAISSDLTLQERQAIKQLFQLRREEVTNAERYGDFTLTSRQDVDTDTGFDNLIDSLRLCLEDYLLPYTLSAFDEFTERYKEFERERRDLKNQIEQLEEIGHDDSEIATLRNKLSELEDEYEVYQRFHSDYGTWVQLSNRQDNDEEENKEVFCRESVYVQLNKILLIRIAEDKDLVNTMVSNGGVHRYFDFWEDYTRYVSRDYIDLFETASEELSEVYDYLYSRRLFDWEIQPDSDLNDVLQRTLWHLNHFDFENVDRDVLGHLYQEHLPPEERKALGEFYTPTAVVDLILDSVGYTSDKQLERQEYDLIDPACGSGTFLVRAAGRLLDRLDKKGVPPRDAIEIVQQRIHGLDLNPFACHIAELNLLFQVIDLYKNVKDENPEYTLDRFQIYRTDSLRNEAKESLATLQSSAIQRQYREERRRASQIKEREDYGFVVGNPPYVRIQNLAKGQAREEYDDYDTAHYNYDIYILFIERAAKWLAEDGQLGYIISNKFTENRYGEKIQDYILQHYHLQEIINFGDVSVFEGVQSYPMIITGKRINKDQGSSLRGDYRLPEDYAFTYAEVTERLPEITQTALTSGDEELTSAEEREQEGGKIAEIIRASVPSKHGEEPPSEEKVLSRLEDIAPSVELEKPPLKTYPMNASGLLDADEWQFVPKDEYDVLEAMEAGGREFDEYEGSIAKNGIQTGSNDVFVLDQATINEYDIEGEVVFPTIGGRDITRWYTPRQDKYILYMTPDADLDETLGAKAYLEANREELESRYCVEQGKHWYQLARHRPGIFAREKVITPDICYYNNFFHDKDTEFHALNSAYVLYADNLANNYLVGVLNSDAVQFYMRRTAPQYGNDYLRYVTSYLFEIPIPDPENNEGDLVETVKEASDSLRELAKDYREAKGLLEAPEKVYERTSGVEISTLSFAGYIDAMNISGEGGDVSATVDGDTVRLNVQDEISFVSEREAAAFESLLQAFEVDSVDVLEDLEVPKSTEGLLQVVDAFEEADRLRKEAVSDAAELEKTLNDAVYKLYGFDDEHRELIEERIDKPEDLLEAKVRT